jgi:hypothetical protein
MLTSLVLPYEFPAFRVQFQPRSRGSIRYDSTTTLTLFSRAIRYTSDSPLLLISNKLRRCAREGKNSKQCWTHSQYRSVCIYGMMNSKTVPEIEMNSLRLVHTSKIADLQFNFCRNNGSSARLPGTEPTRDEHVPPLRRKNSKIWDFFRHVRLLMPGVFIGSVLSRTSSIEDRKVAAYQNRCMAVLNSLLHMIPLSGSLALIVLHWTKYWVGGSSNNATALQFLAKLHELLMQASLVDLLLYIIRAQALEGFIPLGALSGAAQSPRLSYLWSLDFVAAISAPNFSAWRKIIFSFSAFVLLFMAATVGPSSAVLMISQPEMPKLNNTVLRFVNVSENVLFPTRMDKTSGLNL